MGPEPEPGTGAEPTPGAAKATLSLSGTIPPEVRNRLGTEILPKLRSGAISARALLLTSSGDSMNLRLRACGA